MQLTKKELIQQYNAGILNDVGVYNPSAFDAWVLTDMVSDEYVFGYYQYEKNEKEFFKVRLKEGKDDYHFEVKQVYLKLSMFWRMPYR
jgi:hypothetical protein